MNTKQKCNITRDDAVKFLKMIANEQVIKSEAKEKLTNIAACIEGEMSGRHEWGISIADSKLIHAKEHNISKKQKERFDIVEPSIRFTPSLQERPQIEQHVRKLYKDFFGADCSDSELENYINR